MRIECLVADRFEIRLRRIVGRRVDVRHHGVPQIDVAHDVAHVDVLAGYGAGGRTLGAGRNSRAGGDQGEKARRRTSNHGYGRYSNLSRLTGPPSAFSTLHG